MGWFRWEVYWVERLNEPLANVYETEEALVIELALPGLTSEDIQITREGRVLQVVTAERAFPTAVRRFLRMEIPTGPFRFEIRLPGAYDVARVRTQLSHGILILRIPRRGCVEIPVEEGES